MHRPFTRPTTHNSGSTRRARANRHDRQHLTEALITTLDPHVVVPVGALDGSHFLLWRHPDATESAVLLMPTADPDVPNLAWCAGGPVGLLDLEATGEYLHRTSTSTTKPDRPRARDRGQQRWRNALPHLNPHSAVNQNGETRVYPLRGTTIWRLAAPTRALRTLTAYAWYQLATNKPARALILGAKLIYLAVAHHADANHRDAAGGGYHGSTAVDLTAFVGIPVADLRRLLRRLVRIGWLDGDLDGRTRRIAPPAPSSAPGNAATPPASRAPDAWSTCRPRMPSTLATT